MRPGSPAFTAMFVATTLAISLATSLALSPVTTLGAAQRSRATMATTEWMATMEWMAPAAAPAKAGCPAKLEFRTTLLVDTQALGDDAQGVGARLRSKAEQEIQRFDVMLGEDARLPVLIVKIVPMTGEDEGFSYTIDINHGELTPIKDGSSVGECKLCTESELLERVAGSTRALMPKLRGHITDFNNQPCVTADPACQSNSQCKDANRPICHIREKRCVADLSPGCNSDPDCAKSPVGPFCSKETHRCMAAQDATTPDTGMNGKQKAGIGLMVAGALGAGVGIGLVVTKPRAPEPTMAWETRETQKPGYAVLAIGGAALITGVVLFVLGRRQQKAQHARHQVAPVAGAGVFGLSWSGRF